jgi:hypothetical protein
MSVSGKFLTCKYGAGPTEFTGTYGWTVNEKYERLDAITAADDGANRRDLGVGEAAIQIKALVDIANGKYAPFKAGTDVTDLKLYRNAGDAQPAFVFPTARFFDSSQGAEIRGRFEATFDAENVGTYTANEPGAT